VQRASEILESGLNLSNRLLTLRDDASRSGNVLYMPFRLLKCCEDTRKDTTHHVKRGGFDPVITHYFSRSKFKSHAASNLSFHERIQNSFTLAHLHTLLTSEILSSVSVSNTQLAGCWYGGLPMSPISLEWQI
jgi:hypothetical protein